MRPPPARTPPWFRPRLLRIRRPAPAAVEAGEEAVAPMAAVPAVAEAEEVAAEEAEEVAEEAEEVGQNRHSPQYQL